MTKREICERLIAIHNRLFHEYAMADGMEDIDVEEIGKDIGSLIIDIAAPEEKEEKKEKKTSMEIYRPKPIKVLRDPENKHRWKYECPRCRKFTAEKTKYNTIYCGECGHYASTYGWYEEIGFQEIPTDEKTKWPDEPTYNHAKHMLPLEGVIEEMRKEDEK